MATRSDKIVARSAHHETKRDDIMAARIGIALRDSSGVAAGSVESLTAASAPLFRYYFRVKTSGIERLPRGRLLIAANHSGQLPFDALMVLHALLAEAEPPRWGRAMVDRWVARLPGVREWFARLGQLEGSPATCRALLQQEQCVIVFPEGTRGLGKPFRQRYELQRFGTGFARLALETGTPIVPLGVIGAEEIYPSLVNAAPLARWLGTPYAPITPFFPWLGLLGVLPLPSRIQLRFGAPIYPVASYPDLRASAELLALQVASAIETEIAEGLASRRALYRR